MAHRCFLIGVASIYYLHEPRRAGHQVVFHYETEGHVVLVVAFQLAVTHFVAACCSKRDGSVDHLTS